MAKRYCWLVFEPLGETELNLVGGVYTVTQSESDAESIASHDGLTKDPWVAKRVNDESDKGQLTIQDATRKG
jgi:hypothetical protein